MLEGHPYITLCPSLNVANGIGIPEAEIIKFSILPNFKSVNL